MRLFSMLVVAMLGLGVTEAHAQFYVGGGAYMGQGGSSCMPKIPREIAKNENDQKKLEKEQKKVQEDEDKAEREEQKYKKELDKAEKTISGWLKPYAAKAVIDFTLTGKNSVDYNSECAPDGKVISGNEGRVPLDWGGANFCGPAGADPVACGLPENKNMASCLTPASKGVAEARRWTVVTANGPDGKSICYDQDNFVKKENFAKIDPTGGADECSTAISNLKDLSDKYEAAKAVADEKKARDHEIDDELSTLSDEHEDAVEDWQDKAQDGDTAAGYCFTCMFGGGQDRGTAANVMSLVGTLGTAAALYGGIKETNNEYASLGWPTPGGGWSAYAMGYPFMMASIYGGMYGGGSGSFGCSGGMGAGAGGGGAFGYPAGMMSPMAGGMMMPGAYPAAGMGMMGFPAMGYPAMGMPAMGMGMGVGAAMGFPAMGMPAMGMPAMGMPAMGMGMGVAMGMPMMGMPMMGMPAMGMPMMGVGLGMAMGMPAMGYMAGVPFMGMTSGYPAAGMMTGYNPMMMQYQQQMLQMYQMQAQQYMAQQQAQMQAQMQGSMMIGQLQSQMYQIASEIQQISSGVYGGGGYGAGIGVGGYPGIGGSYGYGAGVGGAPAGFTYAPTSPFGTTIGTTTTGTTVLPGRGQGFMPTPFQ